MDDLMFPPICIIPKFCPFASFGATGTGLGLAFCKRVIESVGGEINVRSEYGQYTEFTVLLPHPGEQDVPADSI